MSYELLSGSVQTVGAGYVVYQILKIYAPTLGALAAPDLVAGDLPGEHFHPDPFVAYRENKRYFGDGIFALQSQGLDAAHYVSGHTTKELKYRFFL